MRIRGGVLILVLLALFGDGAHVWGASAGQEHPKLAPYSKVRWQDDRTPEVWVEERWYGLQAIDEAEVADILDHCVRRHGQRWKKRFEEDLVQVLAEMGHEPGGSVHLTLVDPDGGESRVLEDVPMTAENRQALLMAARQRQVPQQAREPAASRGPYTAEQVAEDLAFLVQELERRHSYYQLQGYDLAAAVKKTTRALANEVTWEDLCLTVAKLLAPLGDCHMAVRERTDDYLPRGYLPFLCQEVEGGVVAFHGDRRGLLDDEFPYLVRLDGRDLEDWIEAAAVTVPHGSRDFVRRVALRNLRWVQWVREELGLKTDAPLRVTLRGHKASKKRTLELEVAPRRAIYGPWPRPQPRRHEVLDGDIGYLRIASMEGDREFLDGLHQAMQDLRETRGLILDVRENGGGSRDALRHLLPYFMKPGDPPKVVNVAAYRLDQGDDPDRAEGYLDNRFLYPLTSRRWSDTERAVLDKFQRRFKPQWKLPRGDFSQWHSMTVGPADDLEPYEQPVCVLMDTGCFSATDVFLGAFQGHPGVTLVGTPSGGGSGRSRTFHLPHSRIEVRASTMASYTPAGRLYDGNGIQPDVVVPMVPTDLIGKTDTVLDEAVRLLRKARGK